MAKRPLAGGRVRELIRPTVAVARSCYMTAYANLLLSTSPADKNTWLACMGMLTRDLATSEAALIAFLSRLPGAVVAPATR